jgi:hypothetical protein
METHPYWYKQSSDKPLFPDIEWARPEQRSMRGRLGIIGGNKLGFTSVAESYELALQTGIGEARVLLPDNLKKSIPPSMKDVLYGASNPSGSLARDAISEMKAMGDWATSILLIGDAGRNSETAILYENFIREYTGALILTRDTVDLLKNCADMLVERSNTLLVVSFAQLQKIFQSVYYPKVLTFSIQLTNLVEALHKFTITYPVSIMVYHKDIMVVANNGKVTTTPYTNPMQIWRGKTATRAAVYWSWTPDKPLESVTTSLLNLSAG